MKYYVLSDTHGFYSLMQRTLFDAGYFDDREEKKLVLLGDLFDRGTEALAMQEYILELMERDEAILVRGNHEDLFQDLVTTDRGRPLQHHIRNGTYDTLEQLTGMTAGYNWSANLQIARAGRETPLYTRIIPSMLDYYETRHYVFTHAWVPCQSWYGGLAYEYEFDGKSTGTADGRPIRAASIKGGSVRGEVGLRMEATQKNPWQADISLTGYAGRHRGFGGNVSVAYTF